MFFSKLLSIAVLATTATAHFIVPNDDQDMSGLIVNGIPYSERVKYMRLVRCISFSNNSMLTRHSGKRSTVWPIWSMPFRRLWHHHCEPHLRRGRLSRCKLSHRRSNNPRRDLCYQCMHSCVCCKKHDGNPDLCCMGRIVYLYDSLLQSITVWRIEW